MVPTSTSTLLRAAGEPVPGDAARRLLSAALELSGAHDLPRVSEAVRSAARALTRADGVTFVLREGSLVHYYDEDAIAPLWKGKRFPAGACISGWAMLHRQAVTIEDVFADDRIPHDVYRTTFVRSLAMVPVRPEEPVGAIGAYWADHHRATHDEVRHLTTLAGFASIALANVALIADLREAVAARDAFVGIASHELRTPLAALALQIAAAQRSLAGSAPDGTRASLERIARTTKRLTDLAGRLLDVSTLDQPHPRLRYEAVDLVEIARQAADTFAEPGRTEVRVQAGGPVVGRWDRARIEQAVGNLVMNAVKFGAGQPVDVEVHDGCGEARLLVRDRGIGIPADAQGRIFDRFERAVPTAHYGGFGLGLWIVKRTVEEHGGAVHVTSTPGEGATFTLRLPLSR